MAGQDTFPEVTVEAEWTAPTPSRPTDSAGRPVEAASTPAEASTEAIDIDADWSEPTTVTQVPVAAVSADDTLPEIELVEEAEPPPAVEPEPAAPGPAAASATAAAIPISLESPPAAAAAEASIPISLEEPPAAAAPPQPIALDEPAGAPPAFDDSAFSFDQPSTPASRSFVEGEHRVIVHTVEGHVRRGTIRDLDLMDEVIPLEQQTGFAPEKIPTSRVKAIFFMLPPGARQPPPEGQKIRVTFNDGRQVAGYSTDFQGSNSGFFVVPADTRTNTARIFIYRASVQALAVG